MRVWPPGFELQLSPSRGGCGSTAPPDSGRQPADKQRKARQLLEAALLEGLSSAESVLSDDDWKAIRAEAMTRLVAHTQAS